MSFLVELPKKMPPWWQGDNIRTLVEAYGQALDQNAQVILDGRRQGIVWAGGSDVQRTTAARLSDGRLLECDPWVIQVHADQRGMRIYPTEPELSQRIRVASHLVLKGERGSHRGEMRHLRPYFATALAYPVLWVQHTTGDGYAYWHKIDSAGVYTLGRATNYVRPGSSSKWARYTCFIELPGTGYTIGSDWNAFNWNDGTQYDSGLTVTSAVARDWVAMLTDWKSSHSWCDGVVLVWQAGTIGHTVTPTMTSDGRWNVPGGGGAGAWADITKRPSYMTWVYDNPAP